MQKHERLRVNGSGDYEFSVHSEFIEEDIEFIQKNCIKTIILDNSQIFTESSLDRINILDIDRLIIHPRTLKSFDYSGLKFFKHLRFLIIQNDRPDSIDVSENLELEYLLVANGTKLEGLEKLRKLESLVITKPKIKHLSSELFKSLTSLTHLTLNCTSLEAGFSFLEYTNIKSLKLFRVKNIDFTKIDELELNYLELEQCKDAINKSHLYQLKSLETLKIIDSFNIHSSKDLENLSELKILVVLGKSFFEDGDLSSLKYKLNHFGFDNKKHYSIKFEDFKSNFLR